MPTLTTEEALELLGDRLVEEVRQSQRRKGLAASGRSARSTRKEVSANREIKVLRLLGVGYWRFQQNGRGPGRSPRPSRQMVESITQWVKDKGLDIPPYAIAMKIQREGIRVPNRFNPGGVLSEPLNKQRVTSLLKVSIRSSLIDSARSLLFN